MIPRPGQPGDETWGGMPFESRWCTGVWGQLVYDPVLNLVHYGSTGICPASDFQRGVAGRNATLAGTNERWAVQPETGQVVWRRQLLPQDNWDQECTFEMMLVNTAMRPNPKAEGMLAANPAVAREKVRALVGMPCKNPVFWALGAENGEFFYARETFRGAQNLYKTIDPGDRRGHHEPRRGLRQPRQDDLLLHLAFRRSRCQRVHGLRSGSQHHDPGDGEHLQ